jgi:urease beta subunit
LFAMRRLELARKHTTILLMNSRRAHTSTSVAFERTVGINVSSHFSHFDVSFAVDECFRFQRLSMRLIAS